VNKLDSSSVRSQNLLSNAVLGNLIKLAAIVQDIVLLCIGNVLVVFKEQD
jgi:hypothetical protein